MAQITNHSEYVSLINTLKAHDYRYFTLNAPTISDEEYDQLYFLAQAYEEQHPEETLSDSPTQQCYSENGNGKKQVARRSACLSMKKIHDAKTMVKYLRTQQKACNLSNAVIDVEWKFDGDTVALVYLNGKLAEATYGHGKELMGNDCMDHIKHVQGVPQHVTEWANIDRVEVRGEVIINNANFEAYTGKKKAHRTTCSSFMNKKVAVAQECRLLEFHPFRVIGGDNIHHQFYMFELPELGFLASGFICQFTLGWKNYPNSYSNEELEQIIEDIVCEAESKRDTLPFPTDGLVFKFDGYDMYDAIGTTDHDAKYNAAFKFRPVHKAVTTYRGYHTTIGEKTGKVTYIADYDMVVLNGIECSNANCGSEQTFMAKNLKPGDRIQVSLHGDVIPHIDHVIAEPEIEAHADNADNADNNSLEEENTHVIAEPEIEAHADNADNADNNLLEEEKSAESVESAGEPETPIRYEAPTIDPITPALDESLCYGSYEDAYVTEPVRNQPKPVVRREPKRNYRMVGEGNNTPSPSDGRGGAIAEERVSVFAYILAALALVAIGILCFASLGAAVFFLPLLAGAFK